LSFGALALGHTMAARFSALNVHIEVGHHPMVSLFGLKVNLDGLVGAVFAGVIVVTLFAFGARAAKRNGDGVPSKFQLAFEVLIEQIGELAESALGAQYKRFMGLAVTIFSFILFSNWIGSLPSIMIRWHGAKYELMPPPTSDVNLPLAMAVIVILWVTFESIRAKGVGGYLGHFGQPYKALVPINLIEEIIKPVTMTFRLFGNMFSGVLMVTVMTSLLPIFALPVGELIWKPFDMFIGVIQAFIFMLLTILYMGAALSHGDEH
jgi:F-type H+-transporting ATPase subunit a